MSRTLGPLLVLVLLFGACSAQADPAAPRSEPPRATADAAPYRLDRHQALDAGRALRQRGFHRVLTCPRRTAEGCAREGTARTHWLVGTQVHGARLPRGNGLVELVRTIVMAWPSAARARTYADRLTRQLERYRGEYDIALQETGPGTYTPGDRGRGELQQVSLGDWQGTGLRRVYHYVFDDLSPSANVLGGHFVLRRGRYVVDLEWAARDQRTDRRLSHLPRRLLWGLG
jgi:hypothetical protein